MAKEVLYQLLNVYINYLKNPLLPMYVWAEGTFPRPCTMYRAKCVNGMGESKNIAMGVFLHFNLINPYEWIPNSQLNMIHIHLSFHIKSIDLYCMVIVLVAMAVAAVVVVVVVVIVVVVIVVLVG